MKFGRRGHSGFRDFAPFQISQISLLDYGLYIDLVHGGQKIESNRISSKIHASRG